MQFASNPFWPFSLLLPFFTSPRLPPPPSLHLLLPTFLPELPWIGAQPRQPRKIPIQKFIKGKVRRLCQENPLSKWRPNLLPFFCPLLQVLLVATCFETTMPRSRRAWASDFALDAARRACSVNLFLVFGWTQDSNRWCLSRPIGRGRVQGVVPVIAAWRQGNAVRYQPRGFPELLVARAMIGLGVADSLWLGFQGHRHLFQTSARSRRHRLDDQVGISAVAVTADRPTRLVTELSDGAGCLNSAARHASP